MAAPRKKFRIFVKPLHELKTAAEAIDFIATFDENSASKRFEKYEIEVAYDNGNVIRGQFNDKLSAFEFLNRYRTIATKNT